MLDMNKDVNTIVKQIQNLPTPIIVGISGFGGSGKSTFASLLEKKVHAPIIGVDSFSKSNIHEGYKLWDIMDFQRLEKEVLQPFTLGNHSIVYGDFNWDTNCIEKSISIRNDNIIIIEGVGLFRPNLMKYFSYTIWIDCPIEEAIKRGKKRDKDEYGNPQDKYWEGIWKKNDTQYFEEFSPKKKADFVIEYFKY